MRGGSSTDDDVGGVQAMRLAVELARCGLGCRQTTPLSGDSDVNWGVFAEIILRNRLSVLALRGVAKGLAIPDEVERGLRVQADAALPLNAAHLQTLRLLAPVFSQRGVRAAVLKGPVEQARIYGEYFVRPATDVDFIVMPSDVRRAQEILAEHKYVLAPECRSAWWSMFLGEQHFRPKDPRLLTVDLHHQLHQPGCPAPHHLEALWERLEIHKVGAQPVHVLSTADALIVSCLSLVKAMTHREECGGYAADIAARVRGFGALGEVFMNARQMGLERLTLFGLRCADVVFDCLDAHTRSQAANILANVTDARLRDMLLRPGLETIMWPRRLALLAELSDTLANFAADAGFKILGDGARLLLEPKRPPQALPASFH